MVKSERCLEVKDIDLPPVPADDEVQVRIKAVALNHIDVWGWRGMAFARRKLPIVAGVEAAGEVVSIGKNVTGIQKGQIVAMYGARTCGICAPCKAGRDNLCINIDGIYGFHLNGFIQEFVNVLARLVVPAPTAVNAVAAACSSTTFGTAEHMLFDNARLQRGETILIQAGGSGIGTAAIQLAKAKGAKVITTVGSPEKVQKAQDLGADHVINYQEERFEAVTRKITKKMGVDVVFEHVGADTWAGSMLSLKMGGRLVTCGSTSGVKAEIDLFRLFQQQIHIFGSFGCSLKNIHSVLKKLDLGIVKPTIDSIVSVSDIELALERLESRQVFGKIILTL